jgi:hypothetical protein
MLKFTERSADVTTGLLVIVRRSTKLGETVVRSIFHSIPAVAACQIGFLGLIKQKQNRTGIERCLLLRITIFGQLFQLVRWKPVGIISMDRTTLRDRQSDRKGGPS